jgi:hypothetical protein
MKKRKATTQRNLTKDEWGILLTGDEPEAK